MQIRRARLPYLPGGTVSAPGGRSWRSTGGAATGQVRPGEAGQRRAVSPGCVLLAVLQPLKVAARPTDRTDHDPPSLPEPGELPETGTCLRPLYLSPLATGGTEPP